MHKKRKSTKNRLSNYALIEEIMDLSYTLLAVINLISIVMLFQLIFGIYKDYTYDILI